MQSATEVERLQESVAQSGLPTIVSMLSVPDAQTRCSAMWALANMIHAANPAVCKAVMAALPWEQLASLLQDADSSVQVNCPFYACPPGPQMFQVMAAVCVPVLCWRSARVQYSAEVSAWFSLIHLLVA